MRTMGSTVTSDIKNAKKKWVRTLILNTLAAVDAKVGGNVTTITVSASEPSDPATNDLWVDTS